MPIHDPLMLRIHTPILILALLLACLAAGADGLLPRPPGLEPNVRFWKRIYSRCLPARATWM